MPKKYYAISLFSGAGGMDLGMEAAGFTTRLCTDLDYHSCQTLINNRDRLQKSEHMRFLKEANIVQKNIKEYPSEQILSDAKLKKGKVSLVYGGPPCQSFSVFGQRKGMEDPRGTLLWDYIRVIRDIEPTAFIFENVAGLLTVGDGKVFESFLSEVGKSHTGEQVYNTAYYLLDTANFGVPQFRSRLIIFGTKGKAISMPSQTHSVDNIIGFLPANTVEGVLRNMPSLPCNTLTNHVGRKHGQEIIMRYSNLSFGERDSKTRINRLNPDKPSYTIVVGSDKGGGKGHVHPYLPREVTPRESARIQTFPDYWEFSGTSRHPIRQIGNAVPPLFAGILGAKTMQEVFNEQALSYDELLDHLRLDYMSKDATEERHNLQSAI